MASSWDPDEWGEPAPPKASTTTGSAWDESEWGAEPSVAPLPTTTPAPVVVSSPSERPSARQSILKRRDKAARQLENAAGLEQYAKGQRPQDREMFEWEADSVERFIFGAGEAREAAEKRFARAMLPDFGERVEAEAARMRPSTLIPEDAPEGTTVSLEEPLEGGPSPEKLADLNQMSPKRFLDYYSKTAGTPELKANLAQRPDLVLKLKNYTKAKLEHQLGMREEPLPYPGELMAFTGPEEPEAPSRLWDALETYGSLGRAASGGVAGAIKGIRQAVEAPTLGKEEYEATEPAWDPESGYGKLMKDPEFAALMSQQSPEVQAQAAAEPAQLRGPSMVAGRRVSDLAEAASPSMVYDVLAEAATGASEALTTLHQTPTRDVGYEMAADAMRTAYEKNLARVEEQDAPLARYFAAKLQAPSEGHPMDDRFLDAYRAFRDRAGKEAQELLNQDTTWARAIAEHPDLSEATVQIFGDPLTYISPAAVVAKAKQVPGIAKGLAAAQTKLANSALTKYGRFAPEARQMEAFAARERALGNVAQAEKAEDLSAVMEFTRLREGSPQARKAYDNTFIETKLTGAPDEVARSAADLAMDAAFKGEKGKDILRATEEAGLLLPAGTDIAKAQEKYGMDFVDLATYVGSKKRAKEIFGTAEGVVPKGLLNSTGLISDPKLLPTNEFTDALGNVWNAYQSVWAQARTAGRGLAFAGPNAASGIFFAGAQGPRNLRPEYIQDALGASADFFNKNYGGARGAAAAEKNAGKVMDLGDGNFVTRGEFIEALEDIGYKSAGEVQLADTALKQKARELGEAFMEAVPGARPVAGAASAATTGLSDASEFFQHAVLARALLKRKAQLKDPVALAKYSREIADATLDYRRIGTFQKQILREVIPFYNWQHAITSYGAQQLYKNPKWLTSYDKLKDAFARSRPTGAREEHQAEWMQSRGTVGLGPTWRETLDKYQDGMLAEPGSEEYATMVLNDPFAGMISGYLQTFGMDSVDPDAPMLDSVAPWVLLLQYGTGNKKERDAILKQLNPIDPQQRLAASLRDMVQLEETRKVAPNVARDQELRAMRDLNILWYPMRLSLHAADPDRYPLPDPSVYYKTGGGILGKPYSGSPSSRP